MLWYWYGLFVIDDEVFVKEEIMIEEFKWEKYKKVKKMKILVSNIEVGFEVLYNYDDVFVVDYGIVIFVGIVRFW